MFLFKSSFRQNGHLLWRQLSEMLRRQPISQLEKPKL